MNIVSMHMQDWLEGFMAPDGNYGSDIHVHTEYCIVIRYINAKSLHVTC